MSERTSRTTGALREQATGGGASAAGGFPRSLGGYTLQQELGAGGMGVVYLATDASGRGVAVKVLQSHIAADPRARERLRREFSSLRRVDSPRVAPLLDADLDVDVPFLVTKYIPGLSLDQRIARSGPLAESEVRRLAQGLAEALGAIHRVGVIHRDLKPTNVLMVGDDPVVIDFGIAQAVDDHRLTQAGVVMGTPGYLPPEVLRGEPTEQASDWWGWAATCVYAVTGRPPFGRGPLDAVLARVQTGRPDLEGVPENIAAVFRAALARDVADRPDPGLLLDALHGRRVLAAPGRSGADTAREDDFEPIAATQVFPRTMGGTPKVPGTERVEVAAPSAAAQSSVPADDDADDVQRTAAQPRLHTRVMPKVTRNEAEPTGAATARDRRDGYVGFGEGPVTEHPEDDGGLMGYFARRRQGRRSEESARGATLPPASHPDPPHAWGSTHTFRSVEEDGVRAVPAYQPPAPQPRRAVPAPAESARPASLAFPLFALALLVMASAASFPIWTVIAAAAWAVVARVVYAAVRGVQGRRMGRALSAGDVVLALVSAPLRAIPAALVTVLIMFVVVLIAVAGMFGAAALMQLVGAVGGDPFGEMALAAGAGVALIVAWWGLGGAPLRRGTRLMLRAVAPGRHGPWILGLILLVVTAYLVLRLQATGTGPEWDPLSNVISDTFGAWR